MKDQNEKPLDQTLLDMTWKQKVDFMFWVSYYPSISVLVFLRKELGFRMLKPYRIWIVAVIIAAVPLISMTSRAAVQGYTPPSLGDLLPLVYAGVFLITAYVIRCRRWFEYLEGKTRHSYQEGKSRFEKGVMWITNRIPLLQHPKMLALFSPTPWRIRRYFDPLFVLLVALFVSRVSIWLGVWLLISSFFLIIFEDVLFEKRLDNVFDINDSTWISEGHDDVFEHFRPKTKETKRQARVVLATGRAADTEALQKQRERKL